MAGALAQHDARARLGRRRQPRRHRQDHRRRAVRRLPRPARRREGDGDVPAIAGRSRGHQRHPDPRALRPAPRRARAARQRLLRHARQPHGADHERRPRRPDPDLAGSRRRGRHPPARADHAPRSRQRPTEGPGVTRARLPDRPSRPAGGLPRAALARSHAQQPARAAHVLRRARARAGGGHPAPQGQPPAHAPRHGRSRQDPAVAADRGRHARRVSRRHLVHGSRADPRSHLRSQRGCPGARRARRAGQADREHAVRAPQVPQDAAHLRQLRAGGERMRVARQRDPESGARRADHRLEPRSAARSRRADLSGTAAGVALFHRERRDPVAIGSRATIHGARAIAEARFHADRRAKRPRSPSSSIGSRASRLRWNSPLRGCARCPSRKSTSGCTTGSRC